MRLVKRFLIILLGFLLVTIARANGAERSVQGEDILQTATATANTDDLAAFQAEAQAVRALVVECGIAHRNIKIYSKTVEDMGSYFKATITAGLDFTSCSESHHPTKAMVNKTLTEHQKMYDKFLSKQMHLQDDPAPVDNHEELHALDEKLDGISKAISHLSQPQIQIIDHGGGAPRAPASKGSCAQYHRLMNLATAASMRNTPPGNMAQGQAADYYNQAQDAKAGCQ